jgi:hypothetical protein
LKCSVVRVRRAAQKVIASVTATKRRNQRIAAA